MNAPLKKCSAYGADIITPHLPQAVFQRRVSTDTDTVFASARPESADKTITRGTDKSVPYKVRSKTQQRTNAARGNHGFVSTLDTGLPEIYVSVGAPMRH